MRKLARAIHLSHERAPTRDGERATRSLATYLDQNEAVFAARPDLFDPARAAALARESARGVRRRPAAADRARRSRATCAAATAICTCATSRSIDGEPVLFDAIEFDPDIATGDILYDLAFALMDLWERDLRPAANLLLASYLSLSDEAQFSGLAALPLFMSIRAAIRAKVEAANIAHREPAPSRRARETRRAAIFSSPRRSCGPRRRASSRSAASRGPARARSPPRWRRKSAARRARSCCAATSSASACSPSRRRRACPTQAYGEAANRETYARLARKAGLALRAGHSVVIDAVHAHAREREAAARLAADLEVPFAGLWLEAPLALRLQARRRARARRLGRRRAHRRAQTAAPLVETGWSALDARRRSRRARRGGARAPLSGRRAACSAWPHQPPQPGRA